MKKILFMVAMAILLPSCMEEPLSEQQQTNVTEQDYEVSEFLVPQDEAIETILSFLGRNKSETRNNSYSITHINNETTRNGKTPQGFYLLNFNDNYGYALISADKRDTNTVYMFSDHGNLKLNVPNPNVELIFDLCNNYQLKKIQKYNPKDFFPITRPDIVINYSTTYDTLQYIPCPIINKIWDQWAPFNVALNGTAYEGCPMGCGPLAIALICTNFHHPKQYNGHEYNWELIDQMNSSYNLFYNSEGAYEVSKLIKDVGTMSNVRYTPLESPIYTRDISTAFDICKFNYSYSTDLEADYYSVINSLKSEQAVLITGTSDTGGHAWVLDGFMKTRLVVRAFDQDGNSIPNTIFEELNYQSDSEYVHCNMGWNGSGNKFLGISNTKTADLAPTRTYIYTNVFLDPKNKIFEDLSVYYNLNPEN